MDLAFIARRLDAYERLVRLDKPIGTLLLLWPTLWAVWLAARGRPPWDIVLIFVVGTVLMRSAGCAINDYADRDFDAHVERTRRRPLAAGEISPAEALGVGFALAAAAFVLVLHLDALAIGLSFVALAIAWSYPFTKRFFALPQAYLGIAFGFGIPMAYAAIQGRLPWECWVLLAANVCYAFAYDTEYAMVDRNDDLRLGMRTSAITLGRWDVSAVMASYAAMLAILAGLGIALGLRWPYFAGLAVAAGLAARHWWLIRERTREGCFRAFMQANWIGAAVFAGILFPVLLHWIRGRT
ncbi:MAG: 4-hydroxybenzoate polyprenyltransferase [Betaproteobacteria bacterium RIFCSPLOWO2_12_FULL_67_28]|nr:MAG: 4-hydroxybenzoate polyprenyltransferase [Betaproteobacteria bacterium RIFCSPLOWO2_02_FULL_68_150]OGA54910.1 MAG: 4-hydroxybenzoate polyprenyltransferase [Betaproteobacteria bacterium RIFCSPLOWO2_12_FULL_67_28]